MPASVRPWRPSDAPVLLAASADPELARQFGGVRLDDVAAAEAFIGATYRFDGHARYWAIVADVADVADFADVADVADGRAGSDGAGSGGAGARVVGCVGVTAIEHTHGTAWVSYWLTPEARGRGLATRALAAAAEDAFALGLHRLELGHRTNNPASCAVATRAGFRAEGVEREKLRYGDDRFDVETHARLATDPTPDTVPLPRDPASLPPRDPASPLPRDPADARRGV
ncbi:GNAT family N-acetyltransferase [Curtobacterium sp. MCBA15_016]|uniref:GNAT family N-acetyltransferase n=1 Tax=Curtobacterium sp. MCBA15_016 TaxID=1898740 RepID=UPI0009F54CC7|nr:GNAT family protein [Curtobacterium sp. MCBA15_016]